MNKIGFLFLFIFTAAHCCAQPTDEYEPYISSDYSTDKYQIKKDSALFFKYKIEITQIKLRDNKVSMPSDFYCRGWLTISQGTTIIKQLYFKAIEPVGGCSGLFIPLKQPRKDYFIISKFGDYAGFVFIIDTTGKVTERQGGMFYVSADKRYLFSMYDSDLSGLTVYDFNKKSILFSNEIEPFIGDWYYKDKKYFAEIWNLAAISIDSNQIAIFNFNDNKLSIIPVKKNYLNTAVKLKVYNDVVHHKNCTCGQ